MTFYASAHPTEKNQRWTDNRVPLQIKQGFTGKIKVTRVHGYLYLPVGETTVYPNVRDFLRDWADIKEMETE